MHAEDGYGNHLFVTRSGDTVGVTAPRTTWLTEGQIEALIETLKYELNEIKKEKENG